MVRLAQGFRRLANLALAGQKDEHVARAFALRFVHRLDKALPGVTTAPRATRRRRRPVAHLDRIEPTRHLDHRRRLAVGVGKMACKALGVERRRGDDHLEIGALAQQALEIAEQEIDVEAALVRLVDDQRVVGVEKAVALRFGEQDAVGHQLDVAARADAVGEADLVAHRLAERAVEFLGDARRGGACGNATRLRVADQAADAAPQFEADLR